jgi:hypothetical protein
VPDRVIRVMFLALTIGLVVPADAFAYLDPGSGSMIFQTIAAALAGIAYGVRVYWHKIRTLFGKRPNVDTTEPRTESHDQPQV